VLGALALAGPFILRSIYLRDLLVLFVIFAILALSLDIIMGYMGQYSFGHQMFFGLAAYTTAMLSVMVGVSPWLSFFAGIGLATGFGFLVGYLTLRATRGVYLAIVTYGIAVVLFIVVLQSYEFTRGPTGIYPIPPLAVPGLVLNTEISFYYVALAFLIFTGYLITRWLRSRFGRAVVAIRENEELAKSTGIFSFRYYVLAFTMAAALAGLAGSLYAHYLGVVNPMLLSTSYIVMMLLMVIVGGTGTIWGPIVGSAIYVFGLNLLPTTAQITFVIFGAIILACVIFLPQGIYPRLASVFSRPATQRKGQGESGG